MLQVTPNRNRHSKQASLQVDNMLCYHRNTTHHSQLHTVTLFEQCNNQHTCQSTRADKLFRLHSKPHNQLASKPAC